MPATQDFFRYFKDCHHLVRKQLGPLKTASQQEWKSHLFLHLCTPGQSCNGYIPRVQNLKWWCGLGMESWLGWQLGKRYWLEVLNVGLPSTPPQRPVCWLPQAFGQALSPVYCSWLWTCRSPSASFLFPWMAMRLGLYAGGSSHTFLWRSLPLLCTLPLTMVESSENFCRWHVPELKSEVQTVKNGESTVPLGAPVLPITTSDRLICSWMNWSGIFDHQHHHAVVYLHGWKFVHKQ